MKSKKYFILFFLFVFLFSSCEDEPDEVVFEQYTFERQIAYIYYYTEVDTTRFGDVVGYDKYLVYGIIEPDGNVTEYEDYADYYNYSESHTITFSDRDYVLYTVKRTINYTDEWYKEEIIDYDFYLTEETLKDIAR